MGSTIGCQKEIAEKIIKDKADYLLALKGNQGHLHSEVSEFFIASVEGDFKNIDYDFHEEVDTGHGRIEARRADESRIRKEASPENYAILGISPLILFEKYSGPLKLDSRIRYTGCLNFGGPL